MSLQKLMPRRRRDRARASFSSVLSDASALRGVVADSSPADSNCMSTDFSGLEVSLGRDSVGSHDSQSPTISRRRALFLSGCSDGGLPSEPASEPRPWY